MTPEQKAQYAPHLLILGALPALIFIIITFIVGNSFLQRSQESINSLDMGAGFASMFAVVIIPAGCLFLGTVALTRIPQRTVYWIGAFLAIVFAQPLCFFGIGFTPGIVENGEWPIALGLIGGAFTLIIAAVTGVLGWHWFALRE